MTLLSLPPPGIHTTLSSVNIAPLAILILDSTYEKESCSFEVRTIHTSCDSCGWRSGLIPDPRTSEQSDEVARNNRKNWGIEKARRNDGLHRRRHSHRHRRDTARRGGGLGSVHAAPRPSHRRTYPPRDVFPVVFIFSSCNQRTNELTALLQIPPPTLSSYIPFLKSDDSAYSHSSSSPGLLSRIRNLGKRNNRSAAGAYEPPAGGRRGNFGPLDPDEAWDSRVHDGYGYEEDVETGYRGGAAAGRDHGGSGYEMNVPGGRHEEERGRTGRNPFADDVGAPQRNPFGDDEAGDIRGVSPRPMDRGRASEDRRSAFREDV